MTITPHRGDAAPGYLLYLTDPARAAIDYTLLGCVTPLLAASARGDNHPVLALPRDASTSTLRTVLRQLGYRTYGWRLGRNIGPTRKVVHGLRARLAYLTNRHQRPATLNGCSLGGIYARRLARRTPQAVRQVITLSSPIRLVRHEQSRAHRLFHLHAHQHIEPLNLPLERDEGPLPVPATSIDTPLDLIVAWRTCLDEPSPRTEKIAVLASHLGIANHPAALWAMVDRLAQPADQWEPFQPPPLLRTAYLSPGS